jgi:cold shock CspA family protein
MTGTVTSIRGTYKSFCLITDSTGTDYFAHRSDFVDRMWMRVGQAVEFRVKLASSGKRPAATDVVAIPALSATSPDSSVAPTAVGESCAA